MKNLADKTFLRQFGTFHSKNEWFWPVVLGILLFVPWLGEMFFYSKGEPREALVAVSMLESGNWILPECFGSDIPYKPPLLAWLISIFSILLNGGTVNEFISRLPSALAGIFILFGVWKAVRQYRNRHTATVTVLILMTSFEFFRSVTACRVDMLLTFFLLGAVYWLFKSEGKTSRYVFAILFMSGAVLTKGPVGAVLPCLVMGAYWLLRRELNLKKLCRLALVAVLSLVLPAIWYWLAYRQGGREFIALAVEENIGRMTGTMSYESHLNPWYYNVVSLLAGFLPWTLPVLCVLCLKSVRCAVSDAIRRLRREGSRLLLLAVVLFFIVLIFYTLPASKRSVYLLPCYPSMALVGALLLTTDGAREVVRFFAFFFVVLGIVAPVALVVLSYCHIPRFIIETPKWYQLAICLFPCVWGLAFLFGKHRKTGMLKWLCGAVYLLFLSYNAAFAPMIMNARSDRAVAEKISRLVPDDEEIVMDIKSDSLFRYYSVDFYLDNRLRLRTGEEDAPYWVLTDDTVGVTSGPVHTLSERSADNRRPVYLLRFEPVN